MFKQVINYSDAFNPNGQQPPRPATPEEIALVTRTTGIDLDETFETAEDVWYYTNRLNSVLQTVPTSGLDKLYLCFADETGDQTQLDVFDLKVLSTCDNEGFVIENAPEPVLLQVKIRDTKTGETYLLYNPDQTIEISIETLGSDGKITETTITTSTMNAKSSPPFALQHLTVNTSKKVGIYPQSESSFTFICT